MALSDEADAPVKIIVVIRERDIPVGAAWISPVDDLEIEAKV
jgi:hypothetical protein